MIQNSILKTTISKDLISGLVVFLVALPLCLGVALASNAPLFSGIIAGIIGGIVVGIISGSSTSVSGPAAGLTAVVAAQIMQLGSFEAFLVAVIIAGLLQIVMSIGQIGFIAAFFPSSVIKGLLAAIGIILILKQIPHVLGHDIIHMGDDAFQQADSKNTFTELISSVLDIHPGAALIGIFSLVFLEVWDNVKALKNLIIPSPLLVILFGTALSIYFKQVGGIWSIGPNHLVQVPVSESFGDFLNFLIFPDFSTLLQPPVYVAGITIAAVASLETLLNIEAVDKIDPKQRNSPPNRELLAQGIGNTIAGLIGGLPMTSVIIRSSVNINAGVQTKLSTIWHGILLFVTVLFIPTWLNEIPLSALAAILLVTGFKLASPKLFLQMWNEGKNQFLPFIITVIAIVLTDLLVGVLIGLAVAIGFILLSQLRRPIKKTMEKHATGDEVLHIDLPNQVGFLNKASLENTLRSVPRGGHVLLDASSTDYIDPDILDLITDFQNSISVAHGVKVSLKGFKDRYPKLEDKIQYIDFSSREMQDSLTPDRVLEIFKEGNERFRNGNTLTRDVKRILNATSNGQYPMAAVLTCIDSRTPTELIFDLGLGDIFSVRIAGNIVSRKVIGSLEFSCAVAGAKLILVMGHTSCGAVKEAVHLACTQQSAEQVTGCENLDSLIDEIQESIDLKTCQDFANWSDIEKATYANDIAYKNVQRTMRLIRENSTILNNLVEQNKIAIVGAMYNISTAEVVFF